jgi:hypothetical protein
MRIREETTFDYVETRIEFSETELETLERAGAIAAKARRLARQRVPGYLFETLEIDTELAHIEQGTTFVIAEGVCLSVLPL